MDAQERPRLPQLEAQECRARAEEALVGNVRMDVPQAIAWALLAVAGELHIIRKQLSRR